MKFLLALLLCLSLAANILLFKNRGSTPSPSEGPGASSRPAAELPVPALPADTWALIQAGDPASVEKLRALGLESSVINALVRSQVDARYRARERALQRAPGSIPFWDVRYSTTRYYLPDPLKSLDLRREKNAELKALLGDDYRKNDDYVDYRTAFLPPGKAEELRLLNEDYDALRQSLSQGDSILLPEDREKLEYLEKQKREDLAALLTPEELIAYDLRSSSTARSVGYQLAAFNATEEEFKKIYELRKAHDEKHARQSPYGGNIIYSQPPGPQSARDELNAKISDALGAERYVEYQRSQDQEYRTLTSVSKRLELPPEKTAEAYALKVSLEKKMKDFKPQPGSPANEQRNAYLATLMREAETGFTAILGEKGYVAYKENSQLYRRLQPPTPPPAAPKS